MNTKTITLGSAVELIDNSVTKFFNNMPLTSDEIADITYATNNNLQIRDYLIGLPNSVDFNVCVNFLEFLANSVDEAEAYAFNTVNAMLQYESGNTEACELLLAKALKANSDYSLAKLFSRVVKAGWTASTMTTMRNELASKVMETIEECSDEAI